MRELLITAFNDAVGDLKSDLGLMPLPRWHEFVFRFMYSRAVARRDRDVKHFFECSGIDLVLHRNESEIAFVEFKFYAHRPRYHPLLAIPMKMKGGPSPQNRQEFQDCIETLRGRSAPPDVLKLVALFYADPANTTKKKYDTDYGVSSGIEDQLRLRQLVSLGPFPSPDAEGICNARLYEVGI